MAMRSVVSRSALRRLMECNFRSSASGFRYFSDGKERVLNEEEKARENVYIHKMEREKMEKMNKKKAVEHEINEQEKSEMIISRILLFIFSITRLLKEIPIRAELELSALR